MATNFRNSSGTDFDSLFDPYVQGTVPANTGFRTSDGVDLAGRYAPLAFGSKRADVGFRTSSGTDVTNLWAAIGTATYGLGFDGYAYGAYIGAATGSTGTVTASRTLTINSDGTWTISGVNSNFDGGPTSGTWLPSGAAVSDFQVQFVGTPTFSSYPIGGSSSNGASSYAAATTSRAFSLIASAPANSANDCIGTVSLDVNLKRVSTGVVTTSTVTLNVEALGWQ